MSFETQQTFFSFPSAKKTSSNSDSEEFEQESRDILYRLEKQSHLARKEHTRTIWKPRSYSNGDEQTWGSLSRDEREGDRTLEPQNYAPIALKEQYPVTAHAPNFEFWTGCREIKRCEESKLSLIHI